MSSRADARSAAGVAERSPRESIEWGIATRCRLGEATSGDVAVVNLLPDGALVAGIDGVGHGREAARAARRAAAVVRANSGGEDLVRLVERCHGALQGTRGAAISVAFVSASESRMTWLGVGNVEGRVVRGEPASMRPKGSLVLARGVAGHELPTVKPATMTVQPGDVLLLATDGVDPGFADALELSGSSQTISERILADHWKALDDALVIVVRYLGVRA
jgi:negative regulator of sigma-B (phosphoserine phosphatase)